MKFNLYPTSNIELTLSPNQRNGVQMAVTTEFASRYTKDPTLIYLSATADKNIYLNETGFSSLNIPIDQHNKLPDVVIYDKLRNWLFLIEVASSHGSMSRRRVKNLKTLLKSCSVGKIYVTAFADFKEFKKHSMNIAWETEVWITEMPDHMIHFNGDKFLGPHVS